MSNTLKIILILLVTFAGCEETKKKAYVPPKPAKVDAPETNWEKGERSTDSAPSTGMFDVKFETSAGDFTMQVRREWAPRGAERFYQLIVSKYFDGAPFYRVVPGFMVQFGMNGDPEGSKYWNTNIPDEKVIKSNTRGMVSYAKAGPDTRSTQLFINFGNNSMLDRQGFSPFAKVTEGMDVVDAINSAYGEIPSQSSLMSQGNQYAFKNFPEIDYIKTAYVVEGSVKEVSTKEPEEKKPEKPKQADKPKEKEKKTAAKPKKKEPPKFDTVKFASKDDIEITGEVYGDDDKSKPFIVLCHQAGWSRGEYREIAPQLVDLGFNCLAIDQRSGRTVNDVPNETSKAADEAGRGTDFPDAEQDIIAALEWAKTNKTEGKLVLWGSSYSAALCLRIAGEHPEMMDAVLAFAPGEYFKRFEKPGDWIAQSAAKIVDPVFVTSARDEHVKWKAIFEAIPGDSKTSFLPSTKGQHGSRALWDKFGDNKAYWEKVTEFLDSIK